MSFCRHQAASVVLEAVGPRTPTGGRIVGVACALFLLWYLAIATPYLLRPGKLAKLENYRLKSLGLYWSGLLFFGGGAVFCWFLGETSVVRQTTGFGHDSLRATIAAAVCGCGLFAGCSLIYLNRPQWLIPSSVRKELKRRGIVRLK